MSGHDDYLTTHKDYNITPYITTEVMITHVTYSDKVQPTAQDLAQIAQDILKEVPRPMQEGKSRFVYRDFM